MRTLKRGAIWEVIRLLLGFLFCLGGTVLAGDLIYTLMFKPEAPLERLIAFGVAYLLIDRFAYNFSGEKP